MQEITQKLKVSGITTVTFNEETSTFRFYENDTNCVAEVYVKDGFVECVNANSSKAKDEDLCDFAGIADETKQTTWNI